MHPEPAPIPIVGIDSDLVISRGHGGNDAFEDDGEDPGVLQDTSIFEQRGYLRFGFAFLLVTPFPMDTLGEHADVAHRRNSGG